MTSVSVIIPTCDRPHMLAEALASVQGQTRPADQVIVVDNGVLPLPEAVTATYDKVRFERIPPRSGASFARNWGAWIAGCDTLAFLDDDDLWPEDYLARMLACLEETDSDLVAAPQRLADSGTETERPIAPNHDGQFPRWTRLGYRGSNMIVRTTAFWAVQGFPTRMLTGEDRAFAIELATAGHQIRVCPDAHSLKREHAGTQLTDRATLALGKLCFLNEFGARMRRADLLEDRLAVVISLSHTWGWPLWLVGVAMAPRAALRRARKYWPLNRISR
ncbi:glycosyltransferase family 2 protein [Rhodovibrio salinarum]|uniref:Glycosyltransferase 2-like domain-containing protein n=1 Tax=Rhodovibrio salinarum TaxID=1087 RepID=A0A934UZ15_9PROT|nr:glycosyltransferase family 2 protein [Rhodovibrio salinarum]MBK1696373.1 hypothetical protein [Rhodovibrio salinarum]